MQPTDLAAHRAKAARRGRRRLAVQVRQATLHATDDELVDLELLTRLVRLEQVPVAEAETLVSELRQRQHARIAA